MREIVVNSGDQTLTHEWRVSGTITDVGAVTVTITDAAGTAIATDAATTNTSGTYTYTLGNRSALTVLKVVWSDSDTDATRTDWYEVVGNVLFDENEARTVTYTGSQTPLASASEFTDAEIDRVRRLVLNQFELRTGTAWTRRYARAELVGDGTRWLKLWKGRFVDSEGNEVGGPGRTLPTKLISVTNAGTAVAASDVEIVGSRLYRKDGFWTAAQPSDPWNVVVEYEYGPDPVPYEANEHGLRMAVANLVPSDVSGWAESFTTPDGSVRYSAGLAWPSDVYDWLKNHPRPPVVA